MSIPMQSVNRGSIRRSIGQNTGDVIVGTAKSTADTSSLIDTVGLQRGGADEYNGWEGLIYDAAGSIVDGERSIVSDFDGTNKDATFSPVFSANITSGDKYELWRPGVSIDMINDKINQAITRISAEALKDKITAATFTERYKYEYNCLSSFVAVDKVEYVKSMDEYYDLDLCETVWNQTDSDVTASIDQKVYMEGAGILKLVVAAGASAGDILATDTISSTDISNCDAVEISLLSTTALAASDLQLLLDNTAACASPVETLNIPATTANTKTRHIISLANPLNDTAIISVGIKMVVDKGAFTLMVDHIRAVNTGGRHYVEVPRDYWSIVKGTTPYLKLASGHPVPDNTLLRVTGYQIPTLFTDDSTNADVDPGYLIAQATADLLATNQLGMGLSSQDKQARLKTYTDQAAAARKEARAVIRQGTKWV